MCFKFWMQEAQSEVVRQMSIIVSEMKGRMPVGSLQFSSNTDEDSPLPSLASIYSS